MRGIPPSKRAPPSFELLSLLDNIILRNTAKLSTHRPLESPNVSPSGNQKHHHTTFSKTRPRVTKAVVPCPLRVSSTPHLGRASTLRQGAQNDALKEGMYTDLTLHQISSLSVRRRRPQFPPSCPLTCRTQTRSPKRRTISPTPKRERRIISTSVSSSAMAARP